MTYQADIIAMRAMLKQSQNGRQRLFSADTLEPLHFWPRKRPAPVESEAAND